MNYYTGVGARVTPGRILEKFERGNMMSTLVKWGCKLASAGFTLRSGGAEGADTAFEHGCNLIHGNKEIYLPWKGFNNSNSPLYYIPPEAFEIAGDVYGATWKFQKQAVKKFMARNMMQVMGIGLDEPSEFLLCWTPDGCTTHMARTRETGGTGQAIAYASELNIPVFNFFNTNDEKDFSCRFI